MLKQAPEGLICICMISTIKRRSKNVLNFEHRNLCSCNTKESNSIFSAEYSKKYRKGKIFHVRNLLSFELRLNSDHIYYYLDLICLFVVDGLTYLMLTMFWALAFSF